MTTRVFLDTNVLFSACYSPSGVPGQLCGLAAGGEFDAIVSLLVLEELAHNIAQKAPQFRERLLGLFQNVDFEVHDEAPDQEIVRWRDSGFSTDAPILAAANRAQVDAFCTGDRGILAKETVCQSYGLTVVTPRWLLDQLTADRP